MHDKPYLRKVIIKKDQIQNPDIYPFNIPIIKNIDEIEFTTPVTFIVGENGSGKSTLIEAIAIAMKLNPEGGNKATFFQTEGSHSVLHSHIKTVKGVVYPKNWYFLRAESFYNVATYVKGKPADPNDPDDLPDEDYSYTYGVESLHSQSHGETFMALLQNKLHGNGFYILDEPEAALSPSRQLSALIEIDRLVKSNSQLIIATHSPILMAYPNSTIYQINENGLKKVNYYETEHYKLTRQFLSNTDLMINELLK
jgi:predicted ATPase